MRSTFRGTSPLAIQAPEDFDAADAQFGDIVQSLHEAGVATYCVNLESGEHRGSFALGDGGASRLPPGKETEYAEWRRWAARLARGKALGPLVCELERAAPHA